MPCEVKQNSDKLSVQTTFNDSKNIKLVSTATVPIQLEIIKGQENPEQGWISLHSGERVAVPTAVFIGKGKLPILIATVIRPFQDSSCSDIKIKIKKSLPFQAEVLVQSSWGEDFWIINLENKDRMIVNGSEKTVCVDFVRKQRGVVQEGFFGKFDE